MYTLKNVNLTHNSTPDGNDMILFIGGPVDWEEGLVDWRGWETSIGDIGEWEMFCD